MPVFAAVLDAVGVGVVPDEVAHRQRAVVVVGVGGGDRRGPGWRRWRDRGAGGRADVAVLAGDGRAAGGEDPGLAGVEQAVAVGVAA